MDDGTLKELFGFISPDTRPDVRFTALNYLLGVSSQTDAIDIFKADDLQLIRRLVALWMRCDFSGGESKLISSILINATTFPTVRSAINSNRPLISQIVGLLAPESASYAFTAQILSNLTIEARSECALLTDVLDMDKFMTDSLERFISITKAETEDQLYPAYVLRNLTQLSPVRANLVANDLLPKLYPLVSLAEACKRKEIAVDVLRNISFDSALHPELAKSDEFLVSICRPLIGGEELADEETDKLPMDLQYMEDSKQREPDGKLRMALLETLYQVCSTVAGRAYLRGHGVYYVLREYEKWETDKSLSTLCRDIIGVLIRTEEDMGLIGADANGDGEGTGDLKDIPDDHLVHPAAGESSVIRVDEISKGGMVRMD